MHLMARLSGRHGAASSAPRAKKIESRRGRRGRDLPREVGGSSLVAARCVLALAPRRTRQNERRDAIERGIRGGCDFEGTHRPAGRATREGAKLAVLSESRVAAIFAFVPCAGVGGEAFGAEGLGLGPRDFGESSGGWSACGEATRAVCVWRASPRPMYSQENCQIGRNAGTSRASQNQKDLFRLDFCDWRHIEIREIRRSRCGICHMARPARLANESSSAPSPFHRG